VLLQKRFQDIDFDTIAANKEAEDDDDDDE
jgi:hypothetical protein